MGWSAKREIAPVQCMGPGWSAKNEIAAVRCMGLGWSMGEEIAPLQSTGTASSIQTQRTKPRNDGGTKRGNPCATPFRFRPPLHPFRFASGIFDCGGLRAAGILDVALM